MNIDKLMQAVSAKLGTTPQKLKEALQSGDFSKATENMSPKDAEKLNAVLNNPEALSAIMKSKQAQELKKSLDN